MKFFVKKSRKEGGLPLSANIVLACAFLSNVIATALILAYFKQ